ncbi:hypothetical protein Bca101_046071 [Brassica carinata]
MRSVSGGWFISYTRVACGSFCYSLKTTHTITWEEYKNKQKEEDMKNGELEADTDKLMHEYRAQLDAERALKLSQGRNYSSDKSRKGYIINLTLYRTSKTFFVRILVLTVFSNDLTDKYLLPFNTDGAMSFIASISINHVDFAALFILRIIIQ